MTTGLPAARLRFTKRFLRAGQIQERARVRLAGEDLLFAQEQQHDVGSAGGFDCRGEARRGS